MRQGERSLTRRLGVVVGAFVLLILVGTLGYALLEGWSWHDALFMTVITLSTVGFGEVQPLTPVGELFTIVLIIMGVGGAAYTFSTVADYIVAGELRGFLRRQRMVRQIAQMDEHYIVCGYGRVGRQVAAELSASGSDVVVVENDLRETEDLEEREVVHIVGDATEDEILRQAGIATAKGLCTCLPDDAQNVFTVLTARTLNPNLIIIARSNASANDRKLRIAGANHVISPHVIGGHRMATQLLNPTVVEFMDVVMSTGSMELWVEEIVIRVGSSAEEKSLEESQLRNRTGASVLAVRRGSGQLITAPDASFIMRAGDRMIVLGTPDQLEALALLVDDGVERLRRRRNAGTR